MTDDHVDDSIVAGRAFLKAYVTDLLGQISELSSDELDAVAHLLDTSPSLVAELENGAELKLEAPVEHGDLWKATLKRKPATAEPTPRRLCQEDRNPVPQYRAVPSGRSGTWRILQETQ